MLYSAYFEGFAWITSGYIYLAMGLVVGNGLLQLRKKTSGQRIVAASLSSSALFFLVSNFGVWAESTMYPKTVAGLLGCYTAGLPFFGNTILGDLFFSAVLFGGYAWAVQRNFALLKN